MGFVLQPYIIIIMSAIYKYTTGNKLVFNLLYQYFIHIHIFLWGKFSQKENPSPEPKIQAHKVIITRAMEAVLHTFETIAIKHY